MNRRINQDILDPKTCAPIFIGLACGVHGLAYPDAYLQNLHVLLPSLALAQALPHLINAVVSRLSSSTQTKTNADSIANLQRLHSQRLYSDRPNTSWDGKPDSNAMPAIVISPNGQPMTAIENRTPDDLVSLGGGCGQSLFFKDRQVRFKQPNLG